MFAVQINMFQFQTLNIGLSYNYVYVLQQLCQSMKKFRNLIYDAATVYRNKRADGRWLPSY